MIQRARHLKRVDTLLRTHPSVAILGARQVGKTTLARLVFHSHLIRHTRHYPGFHQLLVDLKLATWSGTPATAPTGRMPDDIPAVVERIKATAASR